MKSFDFKTIEKRFGTRIVIWVARRTHGTSEFMFRQKFSVSVARILAATVRMNY